MSEEGRRVNDGSTDTARVLAIFYTFIFAAMVCGLFFAPIPQQNEATINQLVGIMSAIQLGIIGFYFGGSKLSETSQKLFAASKERADATIQEIAKAPVIAAATEPMKAGDMNVEVAGDVTVQDKK